MYIVGLWEPVKPSSLHYLMTNQAFAKLYWSTIEWIYSFELVIFMSLKNFVKIWVSPKSNNSEYTNVSNLKSFRQCILKITDKTGISNRALPMMTSSNGNIFRVTGPLCGKFTGPGEFPTQRPVTRSFDVLFDLRLNKRLSKQPWGWWFETLSWSLWHHCNEYGIDAEGSEDASAYQV